MYALARSPLDLPFSGLPQDGSDELSFTSCGPSGRLLNHGYLILHLEGLSRDAGWEGPLPTMGQVTTQVLAHDIEDGYCLGNRTLGCPLPLETKAHGWGESGS